MKKLFILSFASILLLTGCGATDTLSCSYQNNANNGTTKVTYDIDHEDNEIKKVRITYNYDFDNDDDNNNNNVNNATTYNNDVDNDDDDNDNDNDGVNNNNNATNNNTTNNNNVNDNTVTNNDVNNNNNTTNNNVNGNNTTNGNNNVNGNNNATTYNNDDDDDDHIDGVGTGTDGTTNDTQIDDDGVIDGVIGSAIDTIVGGVTSIILDSAGLRDRHATVQNTYGNINGFSVQTTNDVDNNYMVTYVIDYDTISDDDLARLNLYRDLDTMRNNYVNQGFTCK